VWHVFKALFVGFVIGHLDNVQAAAGYFVVVEVAEPLGGTFMVHQSRICGRNGRRAVPPYRRRDWKSGRARAAQESVAKKVTREARSDMERNVQEVKQDAKALADLIIMRTVKVGHA